MAVEMGVESLFAARLREVRAEWGATCHFCDGPCFAWHTTDRIWKTVYPVLGDHQACVECFAAARVVLGLEDGEPLRVRPARRAFERRAQLPAGASVKLVSHTERHATVRLTRREVVLLMGALEGGGSPLWGAFVDAKDAIDGSVARSPYGLTEDEIAEQETMLRNGWGLDDSAAELLSRREER